MRSTSQIRMLSVALVIGVPVGALMVTARTRADQLNSPTPAKFAVVSDAVQPWTGKVIGTYDGDSLTVIRDDKSRSKIRLVSIDAPELGQAFGRSAKRNLSRLAFGKDVQVFPEGLDKYGRQLARIMVDGVDVNHSMVAQGFAWHYRKYSDSKTLQAAEDQARKRKLGLWRLGNAIAPWEFRLIAPREKAKRDAVAKKRLSATTRSQDTQTNATENLTPTGERATALTHWITNNSRK